MLTLKLNPALGLPIYRQIMDGIRSMIASGALQPGQRLPSIRELSTELRINPSSAVKAYADLQHAGVIVRDQGRGTFVSHQPQVVTASREVLLRSDLQQVLTRARTWGFSVEQVVQRLLSLTDSGDNA